MRSIELFSGAGGLALGLEQAGFDTVALFERNSHACNTLRLNRPRWNVLETDVCTVDFSQFGPVDLVAGGPPCQPFSMGGKAKGLEDERDMFPQAVRAIRELSPNAFLFENVRGLLRPAFANYVEFIRLQLTYPTFPVSQNLTWEVNLQRLHRHHTSKHPDGGLIYNVSLHLVDAANFGVPQRRHRVFFVGFRDDINAKWSFPRPFASRDELIKAQFVTNSYWKDHSLPVPSGRPEDLVNNFNRLQSELPISNTTRWRTVRDAIRDLGDPCERMCCSNHVYQKGARAYPGHTGSPLDEPSKALKAGDHGVPGGENMLRYANGRVRYFTIREAARIQAFPDNYFFPGSWTESMRQLGNAVPVSLARCVAGSIADQIRSYESRSSLQPARQAKFG